MYFSNKFLTRNICKCYTLSTKRICNEICIWLKSVRKKIKSNILTSIGFLVEKTRLLILSNMIMRVIGKVKNVGRNGAMILRTLK